jgi:hypothetical protein
MSAPWTPMPNPGGRNREFVRKTVAQYLADLNIAGMGNVYPGLPLEELFDSGQPGSLYLCNVAVHVSEIGESFQVLSGPNDFGGYFARYEVQLTLKHRCTSVDSIDWSGAEDDHDRILDAIKAGLKAEGRDLGRPDVVLQSAAWPAQDSIRSQTDEPQYNDGVRDQWSRISFTVSQYMQQQP